MKHVSHTEAHPEVPVGGYCYGRHTCPHATTKRVNGVDLPYCDLLRMGSVPGSQGSLSALEKDLLREAWGTETHVWDEESLADLREHDPEQGPTSEMMRVPKEFDLSLLWDSVKECGVNDSWNDSADYPFRFHELTVRGWRREFTVTLRAEKRATPSARFWSLLRQLNLLPMRLRKFRGHDAFTLVLPGTPARQARLGVASERLVLAAHMARSRGHK